MKPIEKLDYERFASMGQVDANGHQIYGTYDVLIEELADKINELVEAHNKSSN